MAGAVGVPALGGDVGVGAPGPTGVFDGDEGVVEGAACPPVARRPTVAPAAARAAAPRAAAARAALAAAASRRVAAVGADARAGVARIEAGDEWSPTCGQPWNETSALANRNRIAAPASSEPAVPNPAKYALVALILQIPFRVSAQPMTDDCSALLPILGKTQSWCSNPTKVDGFLLIGVGGDPETGSLDAGRCRRSGRQAVDYPGNENLKQSGGSSRNGCGGAAGGGRQADPTAS